MNIDPKQVKAHGIQLDASGWPTNDSLREWHKKNNPQISNKKENTGFSVPLWIIPLLPIAIVVILVLK